MWTGIPWSHGHVLGLLVGLGMAAAGLGLLWGHRVAAHDGGEAQVAKSRWAGPAGLTQQMRLVLGVSLMAGGYHVAAFASPDAWFPLKVARDLWWVVPVVIGVAVGLTALMDRLTRDQ